MLVPTSPMGISSLLTFCLPSKLSNEESGVIRLYAIEAAANYTDGTEVLLD